MRSRQQTSEADSAWPDRRSSICMMRGWRSDATLSVEDLATVMSKTRTENTRWSATGGRGGGKEAALGGNLPLETTSFVGRKRELTEIERRLGLTRLLTLSGAGGSGKTRLALRAAREIVGSFEDGVWWVDLASLSDAGLVPRRVASALGGLPSCRGVRSRGW